MGSDETVTGSDGDETITFVPDNGSGGGVDIDAGAGDDLIDLYSGIDDTGGGHAGPVLGGDGDDTIKALEPFESLIDGGDGNDVITVERATGSTLVGGEGDDLIDGGYAQEPFLLQGGEGDDTLIGAGNGTVEGGAGNDLLEVSNQRTLGTGYNLYADAGDGDDTIRLDESAIVLFSNDVTDVAGGGSPMGGSGSDTWEVTVDEGVADATDTQLAEAGTAQSDGSYRLDAIEIADFTSGEDVLVIDATPLNDAFTLTTARIEQVDDEGDLITEIVLRYESPTLAARDVTIDLRDSAVTWDDVAFVGTQVPTLIA